MNLKRVFCLTGHQPQPVEYLGDSPCIFYHRCLRCGEPLIARADHAPDHAQPLGPQGHRFTCLRCGTVVTEPHQLHRDATREVFMLYKVNMETDDGEVWCDICGYRKEVH